MQRYIEDKALKSIETKSSLFKIMAAAVLTTIVVIGFAVFMNANSNRIYSQNANYIKDATNRSAMDIEDIFEEAEKTLKTIVYIYESEMSSPDIDYDKLADVSETSSFIHMFFAAKSGLEMREDGRSHNVSELHYYKEGMKGKSGYDISTCTTAAEESVIFYSPVRYRGEIIGVLAGHYDREQLENMLENQFFGRDSNAFISDSKGNIIAASSEKKITRIAQWLDNPSVVKSDTYTVVEESFEKGRSYGFAYRDADGIGNIYMTPFSGKELFIIQSFPSGINMEMINSANSAGLALELIFILMFLLYVGGILFISRRQKKVLIQMNKEMSYIVDGIVKLFDRFILVDFSTDTYKYLTQYRGKSGGISGEGKYSQLVAHIEEQMAEENDVNRVRKFLEKDNIRRRMGRKVNDLRFEYHSSRKENLWETLNVICLERVKGVPVKMLFTRQDVTNVKEEEARFREALLQAFQLAEEANIAKSDFLSRMSHDIRTPMNAIMGMTTIASINLDDRERVKDCLEKINVSSKHLLGIINKVLDMSKIESGKIGLTNENFNLSELIHSLINIFHVQTDEKNQSFELYENIIHGNVEGDPIRLQQVLVNILGNAVKFTPEGGHISFKVEEKESVIPGSGCYEFIVEDNGIGMDSGFVNRIFEPFTREESHIVGRTEGSGLGMSIARNIVQMMNGDMKVESRRGEGSKFIVTIYLKRREKLASDNLLGDVPGGVEFLQSRDFSGKRILLVEDNELNMEISEELLRTTGVLVEKAYDGKEALDMIKEKEPGYYDLVFMDIQMPRLNGYDATRAIRALDDGRYKRLPIVAMSANAFSDDIQSGKSAGMNGYISKPVEIDKLTKAIETWCGL